MRLDVLNEIKTMRGDATMLNKSEISRRLHCDRRTVDKYLRNDSPIKKSRNIPSILDNYKEIVVNKLDNYGCTSMAIYKFIKKKGYSGSYETVNNFSRIHKSQCTKKATIRFETNPGLQAQVDWKEKLTMYSRTKEKYIVNIFLIVLGYSRKKYLQLTTNRNQKTLFECMTNSFKFYGGVPKEILFDNMSTVVDRKSSTFSKITINKSFNYFSKDAGFKIVTCRPYRAKTKGKVETLARFTNRLKPYNEEFNTFEDLEVIVNEFNYEINNEVSQATNEVPNIRFNKEKEYLNPLPPANLLTSYFNQERMYKVSYESMVNYKGQKYSVPIKYIGSNVTVNETNIEICIFYSKDLISCHRKSNNMFNYQIMHVKEILKSDALSHLEDEKIDIFIEKNLKQMDMFLEME